MSDVAEATRPALGVSTELVNAAEDLFALGVTLSDAAIDLYKGYNPNINDLAEVLIAVWADSLGVGTANPTTTKLSNALYNAGGETSGGNWSQGDCQKAAQKVYAVWHSGLTRKSLTDTGAIPYPSTGGVYMSPDIISNGPNPATDAQLATWTSEAGWKTAPWSNLINAQNYLYVREKNLFPDLLGGTVSLYAYRASIGLTKPSTWQLIRTESGAARSVVSAVAQNAIGITKDAFVFNPGSSSSEHLCFVALFSTTYFRNPRPGDSNFDAVRWLTWNGSSGWHNADVPNTRPLALGLANLNATPETFRVEAVCRNVPVGTTVSLVSTDAGGGFDSGALPVNRPDDVLSLTVALPGNHDGTVNVTVLAPGGKALPQGAEIDLRYHWLVESDHPEFVDAARHLLLVGRGLEADGRGALYLGNFLLTGGA